MAIRQQLILVLFLFYKSADSLSSRRVVLRTAAAIATAQQLMPANALLSSQYCASGVGDGCEELSQGNELIRSLQAKSAANKEQYAKEARDAYYLKNYPDWFATVGKTMVKKRDGTYFTVDEQELAELKASNKLTLEIPKAMGGKVVDLTQKPVLMLVE